MTASREQVLHAYRHLHRAALRAVRFEKPARYVARDHIRDAFRQNDRSTFNARKIARTLEFLDNASSVRGLEFKMTKNIVRTWGERRLLPHNNSLFKKWYPFRQTAYVDFDRTMQKLNETMDMCIR